MDAASKLSWLVQIESRGQQGGVEEQPNQVLHRLVGLVCCCLLFQLGHDRVFRVHFHRLLRDHVRCHAAVSQSLSLHDASMFADQPYSDVVRTHGESAIRELTSTFSTLSPKTSFINLVSGSNSDFNSSSFFFSSSSSISRPSLVVDFNFLPSNSFNCWTAYSSIGSTMYMTSRPFLRKASKKGDEDTAAMLSPVM